MIADKTRELYELVSLFEYFQRRGMADGDSQPVFLAASETARRRIDALAAEYADPEILMHYRSLRRTK
jgi:hypothetical protein